MTTTTDVRAWAGDAAPPLGLRERKKQQTREAIAAAAAQLFTERGFDHVTMSDVAEAANVSVKTVFNYFGTKEDLAFVDEDQIIATWVHHLRTRPAGVSPFAAIKAHVSAQYATRDAITHLSAFQDLVDSSDVLQARLRLLWDRLETAITKVFVDEAPAAQRTPVREAVARLAAAQLTNIVRLLFSAEVRGYVASNKRAARGRAVTEWLEEVMTLTEHGLGDFGALDDQRA